MPQKLKYVPGKTYERKTKTAEQALSALMRYAARAERSSGDAMRLMRSWGVPEQDRQKVLDRLIELRFINDERYAGAYVRDKVRLAGWGTYKIRSGLAAKGISAPIIERALSGIDTGESADKLFELIARKSKNIKECTPYERRTKLIRFGVSRGYSYESVFDAVEKIVTEDE